MVNSPKLKVRKPRKLTIDSISSSKHTNTLAELRSNRPSERYSDILEPSVIYDGNARYTRNTPSQEYALLNTMIGGENELEKIKGNKYNIKGVHVIIGKIHEKEFKLPTQLYKMSHTMRYNKNEDAKDPTWTQLKSFLTSNIIFKNMLTGKAKYKTGEFMCQDFNMSLLNNAYAFGIRCGDVSIIFKDGGSHTINVFDTTDHGWVFVDSSAGLVLSKKNFFTQGKSYSPDFAAISSKEKRPSFIDSLRQYFGDGVELMQINW
jgi:hypothetical protein